MRQMPRYADRAQIRATRSSAARYMPEKQASQIEMLPATREKHTASREPRSRNSTKTPRSSIATMVASSGIAYALNA